MSPRKKRTSKRKPNPPRDGPADKPYRSGRADRADRSDNNWELPADEPTAERPGTVALTDTSSEQKAEAARVLAEAEAQLAPAIKAELDRIEKLDQEALLAAVTPIMRPKQAKRLASLNRKAQDEGLTDAEERERDELLQIYEKSIVVRATALAELHKRGVDVSELIAP